MNRYAVKILLDAETPKLARQQIEKLGLKAFEINRFNSSRTISQNSALHKWFEIIEQEAQNNGSTMDMLIKNPCDIPITRNLLKDMFRLIGNTMFHRDSTAKLTKSEIDEVIKVFEKVIAERLGIDLPFPSLESLIEKQ